MAPRPKDSTKEKTEQTRRRILESAEIAFAEKGYDGANMREIAKGAGVNKYMLYYHFEDKRTLFERVFAAIARPIFQHLIDTIRQTDSLEQAIGNVYDLYGSLLTKDKGRLRSFMAREIAAGAPRVRKMFGALAPEVLPAWAEKLEAEMGRPLDEQELSLAILSIMTTVVATFITWPITSVIAARQGLDPMKPVYREHVIQFILGGLRHRFAATTADPSIN